MWLGLFLGLVFGIGAMWLLKKGLVIKWHIWALSALAFLSLYGGITHYVGSIHEYEPTAGLFGLIIFGAISLILAGFAFQLGWRQNKSR